MTKRLPNPREKRTEFGRRLAIALAERNLTQKDLARAAGVSTGYVSQTVNGKKHATPRWLNTIGQSLSLDEETILGLNHAAAEDRGFRLTVRAAEKGMKEE